MTVHTLLKAVEVTQEMVKDLAINIIVEGYGKPMNARVDKVRVHNGSLFILADGKHDGATRKPSRAAAKER